MIDRLDQFMRFQTEALKLRSQRQELLAANMANADTPGYKAVDFDFSKALQQATAVPAAGAGAGAAAGAGMGAGVGAAPAGGTAASAAQPEILYRQPSQASLDGNSVEMDAERARFADNTVRYEAALKFLNAQIKTMLAALQS